MWDTLSKILNVILGLLTIYFYAENRRLKKFEIDRGMKIKETEIKELKRWYSEEKDKLEKDIAEKGQTFSGIRIKRESNLKDNFQNKLNKLNTEMAYLEKFKKYKWLFSKIKKG